MKTGFDVYSASLKLSFALDNEDWSLVKEVHREMLNIIKEEQRIKAEKYAKRKGVKK